MRPTKMFALVGVLTLGLAACGTDEPPSPAPASPAADAGGPAYGGGGGSATVKTSETDLGTILTGPDGLTLYAFGADEGSESTCYDDCAAAWPALTVSGDPAAGSGVDAAMLGTTERTDGTVQVTYGGHPLYYFAEDSAPGDTNGQGVGDVWYVVSPEGDPIDTT
jgi:predicted lipoprotein with Yx(FWY)xxD motif